MTGDIDEAFLARLEAKGRGQGRRAAGIPPPLRAGVGSSGVPSPSLPATAVGGPLASSLAAAAAERSRAAAATSSGLA